MQAGLSEAPVVQVGGIGAATGAGAIFLVAFCLASPLHAAVPYETDIVGTDDKQLISEAKAVAQSVTLQDKPPDTDEGLRRRAQDDLPRLTQVLHSQGFWEGKVDLSLDLAAKPAKVTLKLDPGPLFRLRDVALVTPEGAPAPDVADLDPATFGLTPGDPAKSAPVLDAEGRIVDAFAGRGRPFAKVVDRHVVVDVATKTMSVRYTVDPGPHAAFGPLTIEGLTRLDRDYVERRIEWREGEAYDQDAVDRTRKVLVDSGLFSSTRISHADSPDAAGQVPMHITLAERPPRSLGGGFSYNTSVGFGANGFWENRDVFGGAEKLHVDADVAQQRRDLRTNFRKPDFLDRDQDLTARVEFVDENPVAYTARRELAYPAVERRFGGIYTAGIGVQVQHATVTEAARDITQTYSLAGLPVFLRRDTRDDILNPTKGSRESLKLIPNKSISGQDLSFLTTRFDGEVYQRLAEDYLLAAFVGLGSIVGASRDRLPADQRLYAGGGGSLRGYGYQLAGPLLDNDKPLGGRSLLQFGAELRVKITDTISLVPFVEAGNVYDSTLPDIGKGFLYDAGFGVAYKTPVGPVQLDIATPLVRRKADSIVQIYISIGQAF